MQYFTIQMGHLQINVFLLFGSRGILLKIHLQQKIVFVPHDKERQL